MLRTGWVLASTVLPIALASGVWGHRSSTNFAYACLPPDSESESIRQSLVNVLTDTSAAQDRVRAALHMTLATPDSVYLIMPGDSRCTPAIGAMDAILNTTQPNRVAYLFRFDGGYAVADSTRSDQGTLQVIVLDRAYGFSGGLMVYVDPVDDTE